MNRVWPSVLTFFLIFQQAALIRSQPLDTLRNSLMLSPHYGIGLPLSDMKDRFGQHFTMGGNLAYLSNKNLYFSGNYSLLFGSEVKEDVLSNLRTVEGGIIGSDMQFASVFLRERGHHVYFNGGYFIKLGTVNLQSGIVISAGIGFLSHKIRIVDDFDSVIQLRDAYVKGYDRLSSGISFNQNLTYLHLSKDKLVNFFINAQIIEAFTKDRRQFNYNQTELLPKRDDILIGVQAGWIIPIYLTKETRYY